MWSILGTLALGLLVGALARGLLPGTQAMGWVMTSLLGVAGACLASFVGQAAGLYVAGEAPGWIASVLGALALLWAVSRRPRDGDA